MEIVAVLGGVLLVFAAIFWLLLKLIWRRYRVVELLVPRAGDPQTFDYRMTETIRNLSFREEGQETSPRVFRAPKWMKWSVGLQDISVRDDGGSAVLVTGPGFLVSTIARSFSGVTMRPYEGPQPFWPLLRGCLRLMGGGMVVLVASGFAAYVFGAR